MRSADRLLALRLLIGDFVAYLVDVERGPYLARAAGISSWVLPMDGHLTPIVLATKISENYLKRMLAVLVFSHHLGPIPDIGIEEQFETL